MVAWPYSDPALRPSVYTVTWPYSGPVLRLMIAWWLYPTVVLLSVPSCASQCSLESFWDGSSSFPTSAASATVLTSTTILWHCGW